MAVQVERRALDYRAVVVQMPLKENACVLPYLLYKLILMPLIKSKSDPLCVYLHTACYKTPLQRGRTSELLEEGGSAIQECTVADMSLFHPAGTHLCSPHAACCLTQLGAGAPGSCSDTVSPKACLGMATLGGRSLSDGG